MTTRWRCGECIPRVAALPDPTAKRFVLVFFYFFFYFFYFFFVVFFFFFFFIHRSTIRRVRVPVHQSFFLRALSRETTPPPLTRK